MVDTPDIKPRSRDVTDGLEKTAARGMLRAVGMGDEDWEKPQIGVASSWNEITPCNLSLDRLAKASKEGVHTGGGYPLEFGTISVSDGISIGLAWPPRMTTICPLGPSAVSPIMALRDYFRDEVYEHVARGGCWFPGASQGHLQPVEIGTSDRGEMTA